jgi:phosphoribosylformylglycinamidine synthase PurS subunit
MRATVLVRPKQGILDPQGEAVLGSLRKLGFDVESVRVGRLIDVELRAADDDDARAQLERMCMELLANPLIESFEVELADGVTAAAVADGEPGT